MVKYAIIAIIAIAVLGGGAWWFLRTPSDVSLIKEHIEKLTAAASKSGEEPPLAAAGKAQALANFFADSCDIEIAGEGVAISGSYQREELPPHAMLVRAYFKTANFSTYDINVNQTSKLTAKAFFTVMLTGTLAGGDSVREVRDINAMLVKANGHWLFSSLKIASPIKK